MDWRRFIIPAAALVAVAGAALAVRADSAISIRVNGTVLQTSHPPINQDGTVYIPLRDVAQALGATVTWDGSTETVEITTGSGTAGNPGGSGTAGPTNAQLEQEIQTLKALAPGLGDFMVSIQTHMAKVWYAAQAGNWNDAKFELGEVAETFDGAEASRPEDAAALKAFVDGPLSVVKADVAQQDTTGFQTDYKAAIAACNACHASTIDRPQTWPNGRGFIKISLPPAANPFNQDFNP